MGLLHKCTLVDPRYRGQYGRDALEKTKQDLLAEMVQLEMEHQPVVIRVEPPSPERLREQEDGDASTSTATSAAQAPAPPAAKKRKSLGSLLQQSAVEDLHATPETRATREMEAYLCKPLVNGDTDPLLWWKVHAVRLPLMSRVARKYLCVCATSVPCERMFSTAGDIVCPTRSLLDPEKVNMLTFLAQNLPG